MGLKKFNRICKALINPEEWRMRLLGLPVPSTTKTRRGLVLIQIDGLSYPDFQKAMEKGYMPFSRRLMRREHYELKRMYSGVPSNTPSFQGEFFFGKAQCVPAFQYRDKASGKIFTMFEKNSAAEVEKTLLGQDEGLVAGGTAYGNIFSGGAAESHLCASTADWANVLKAWNPYSLLISLILKPLAMIRGVLLCLVESVLAVVDFGRGFMDGHDFFEEMRFIFTRVLVSILMRDVTSAHVRMDIRRGMPVIHANYFGYDEQAHRRGPSTRFAYWSLTGIDEAVKRIWYTAIKAKRRHYDVWVYSDHGQEKVLPFSELAGRHIRQAVHEVYDEIHKTEPCSGSGCPPRLRGDWGDTVMGKRRPQGEKKNENETNLLVTTLGPICQIYFPASPAGTAAPPPSDEEKRIFAKRLIEKNPVIPLAAIPLANGDVEYETKDGTYQLPRDAKIIFGPDHLYRDAAAEDLNFLFRHESRGDILLFGWRFGMPAISYSNENGAHAGFGPCETQAFALLPGDAPVKKTPQEGWIGVRDLRQGALIALGKIKREYKMSRGSRDPERAKLRVMSYNVHSCVGGDGILSVERIARIIAKSDPDVVALQELDAGRKIPGENQAASIARELEMNFHFHAVCGTELECFGNAILSRYPMRLIRAEHLPMLAKRSFLLEPRGIVWAEIYFQDQPVQILNTHLSLWGPEQKLQIQKLLGPDILGSAALGENAILCGDFNMTPGSRFYRMITKNFKEPDFNGNKTSRNTWTSQWPIRRLDHILVKGNLDAEIFPLPRTRLESSASDHLPIAADFEFKNAKHF